MIRLLAFLLCFPLAAFAQGMPEPLSDTVSDYADLLSADQEDRLSDLLISARKQTGVHIVVVTMGKRQDFGGEGRNIISYAKALFNKWGVGDRQRNDGILILVERDNREMRIALGAGYDAVYDGLAQRVIDREMLPRFRKGDYPAGIEAGTRAVVDRLARPFANKQTPVAGQDSVSAPKSGAERSYDGVSPIGAVAMLMVFALVAGRRYVGDALIRLRTCPNCGKYGLSRRRSVDLPASSLAAGQGTEITRCSFCNHEDRKTYWIPSTRNDNDSSGGFGGGRSSGGGASGKW